MMAAQAESRIPMPVKVLYTAFLCVLVPVYWRDYGPTNFLYFCDVALFLTLAGVWTEKSIWVSMPAVGILMPQLLWMVDFLGASVGLPVTNMTAYMFESSNPLFTRGLSFFHFWLPILLVYLVWRLGYDERAFRYWTGLALVLLLICYFWMPMPPAPADQPNTPVNINYVYGLNEQAPQDWMPPLAWLGLLMIALPTLMYAPTHWVLKRVFSQPAAEPARFQLVSES